MVVVTGGAGFIGSVLVHELNRRGRRDIMIVDHLGRSEKWRNLVGLSFASYCDKADFPALLESGALDGAVDALVHLGACSSTTETDADYLMANNTGYSLRLARWWEGRRRVRFVYASSAATYGDGSQGYSDDESRLESLRPLNMYGYSKHLFDLQALQRGWLSGAAGLKYFNVYGPNEYHKGDMRSFILKAYGQLKERGGVSLFKSHRADYADGEQRRDFLYVKDAVAMTLFFLDTPRACGIYNIGSGEARTWNDCAAALFAATGTTHGRIDYVPMPEALREKYQYFTRADLSKLRSAGCSHQCMRLEDAVGDYVRRYLAPNRTVSWDAAEAGTARATGAPPHGGRARGGRGRRGR